MEINEISGRSKFKFANTMLCLLKALEKRRITVEIRNDWTIQGKLLSVNAVMALNMTQVMMTDVKGRKTYLEHFYIQGRTIRYVHIPDDVDIIKAMRWQFDKVKVNSDKEIEERRRLFNAKMNRKAAAQKYEDQRQQRQGRQFEQKKHCHPNVKDHHQSHFVHQDQKHHAHREQDKSDGFPQGKRSYSKREETHSQNQHEKRDHYKHWDKRDQSQDKRDHSQDKRDHSQDKRDNSQDKRDHSQQEKRDSNRSQRERHDRDRHRYEQHGHDRHQRRHQSHEQDQEHHHQHHHHEHRQNQQRHKQNR